MDINAAMSQFFDEQGKINVPEQLTLSGMCEMLYTMAQMEGATEETLIRYWDFSQSREGQVQEITRAQVNTRIKAVCVRLQQVAQRELEVADIPVHVGVGHRDLVAQFDRAGLRLEPQRIERMQAGLDVVVDVAVEDFLHAHQPRGVVVAGEGAAGARPAG